MSATTAYTLLILLVALERVAELLVSKRNLRWSRERGGQEFGLSHYPVMVVLHMGLLVGALFEVYRPGHQFLAALVVPMLVLVGAAQALRWWCIATLGPRWNTRVVIVPDLPRVTTGPYRWMRHPNYVAVVIEGFALPLVGSAWVTALVFSALNALLLAVRIRTEDAALALLPDRGVVIDLIVAGGGPVGLATASCAALAGMQVVVVEPRMGVIDKACGEGLMPGALAQLGVLGIDPAGVDLSGIRYLSGPHAAEAMFTAGPARGVRRTALHEAMVTRALDLGVRIVRGRVASVEQGAGWVQAADLRGRYLIGADGLHSGVRRVLGLGGTASSLRRFGVRQHFAVAPWSDLVEVHWLPRHEVYVTPVASGTVGVALLGPAPLNLDTAITALPRLARRLRGAAVASPLRGAGPFGQSSTARVAGRVLLVGDAAGYVDALTGEGLRVGLAQARAAVEAIARDEPNAYEDQWRRITRSYRTVTHALLWVAARRSLRPMIVPAARSMPRTFTRVVDQIAG